MEKAYLIARTLSVHLGGGIVHNTSEVYTDLDRAGKRYRQLAGTYDRDMRWKVYILTMDRQTSKPGDRNMKMCTDKWIRTNFLEE